MVLTPQSEQSAKITSGDTDGQLLPTGENSDTGSTSGPDDSGGNNNAGLPIWMPLAGLFVAFLFAVFVGSRICPTLSGLVFQPEPPLPPGTNTLVQPVINKGPGRDEFVYGTNTAACEVAQYYQARLGNPCDYDLNSPCGGSVPMNADGTYTVGSCTGRQQIGVLDVYWKVYINGGQPGEYKTFFRVVREIGK